VTTKFKSAVHVISSSTIATVAAGLPVEKPLTLAASRVRLRSKADEQHSVDIRGFAMYGKPHEARPRTLGDVLFDQMASVIELYLEW